MTYFRLNARANVMHRELAHIVRHVEDGMMVSLCGQLTEYPRLCKVSERPNGARVCGACLRFSPTTEPGKSSRPTGQWSRGIT